jgi:KDO2-lipid IV(A) lauroyltransferase
VYKPLLNNLFSESLMRRLRTRLGRPCVPMLATLRYRGRRGEGRLSLLTDQAAGPRPALLDRFHQDTSFYTSADRLAAQLGAPCSTWASAACGAATEVTFTRRGRVLKQPSRRRS